MYQKWLVKVMYIMLCVAFLTACEKRKVIEEKKDKVLHILKNVQTMDVPEMLEIIKEIG